MSQTDVLTRLIYGADDIADCGDERQQQEEKEKIEDLSVDLALDIRALDRCVTGLSAINSAVLRK